MWAASASALQVTQTEMRSDNGVEQLVLHLDESVTPHTMLIPNPDRLVLDINRVEDGTAIQLPVDYSGNLVKSIRFGQFSDQTSRIVLDLNQSAAVQKSFVLKPEGDNPQYRLVVQIAPKGTAPTTSASKLEPVVPSKPIDKKAQDDLNKALDEELSGVVTEEPALTPKNKTVKDAASVKDKPLIVIDPGHGGVDPGAIGPTGRQEKTLTFDYAKALRRALLKTGKYNVMLTREDDRFVLLGDRVKRARAANADMFISLHADSAPYIAARGLSIYTLSETASDKESAKLAAAENKVDVLSGMKIPAENPEVADILVDLARRETKNLSSRLADSIVSAMKKNKVQLLTNPHRYAGFAVLKAPDIPSILIETGFISNEAEEKLLATPEHRDKVMSAVVGGIDSYLASRAKK